MPRTTLIHLSWSLGALLTFAAGYGLADRGLRTLAAERAVAVRDDAPGLPPSLKIGADPTDADDHDADAAVALTPAQLQELAKQAFNSPNPLTRSLAFAKLLESMTPENVEAVMTAMRENRAGGDQWRLFQYAWGAMDSAGALKHAETLEGGRKRRFLGEVLSGWASKDPAQAKAWLDLLPENNEKQGFRWNLINGMADHDIGLATTYAYERATQGDRNAMGYLEAIAGEELRKHGAVPATRWAEGLPEGPLKGAALDRVAGAYVNEDPRAAAAWAAQFATTDYGARVIEEVGDEWAERDPKAAVAWLETLPEGAGRSEGMHSALREWTQRDPRAASEYLAALPPSPAKDSAVSGFARTLAGEDPESAVIWAATIGDEKSRVETLTRAGRAWYWRDAAAATAWLQQANLPEAAVREMMAPPRQDRRRWRD